MIFMLFKKCTSFLKIEKILTVEKRNKIKNVVNTYFYEIFLLSLFT